ncbi:transposase [Oceanobacillus oncorhynchi]
MYSFSYVLHNGYVGGINNQTKFIKHNAFGFQHTMTPQKNSECKT